MKKYNVSILGSGNTATVLGTALKNAGNTIVEVIARNDKDGMILAKELGAKYHDDFAEVSEKTEIVLLCVSDNAIEDIAGEVPYRDFIVVHTAGSVGLDVISPLFKNTGVLYPFVSMQKTNPISFAEVPIFIEGSNAFSKEHIQNLALTIAFDIQDFSSKQRTGLHLAAVFANNFVNHCIDISYDLSYGSDVPLDLLKPLLSNYFNRVLNEDPALLQTGPAMRNDTFTIKRHLKMLQNDKVLQNVYSAMTKSIQAKFSQQQ